MRRFIQLILVALILSLSATTHARDRSEHFIGEALAMVGVKSKSYRQVLAKAIRAAAIKHNFDPITMIAVIEGESHFNPSLVNSIGCVGLGQICVKAMHHFCKPAHPTYSKAKCDSRIASLKNPVVNINTTASSFTSNRKLCNRITNKHSRSTRNLWRHWLPSHGGYNKGSLRKKTGVWCGQKYVCTKRKGKRCVKKGWRNVPIPKRISGYMKRRIQLIKAVNRKLRRKR